MPAPHSSAPHSFTLAQLQTLPVSRHLRSWVSPPPSPPWPWTLAARLPPTSPPTPPPTPQLTRTPEPQGRCPPRSSPRCPCPRCPCPRCPCLRCPCLRCPCLRCPCPTSPTLRSLAVSATTTTLPPQLTPPTHPSLSTAPPCPRVTSSSSTELFLSQATLLTQDTLNNLSGDKCGLKFIFF